MQYAVRAPSHFLMLRRQCIIMWGRLSYSLKLIKGVKWSTLKKKKKWLKSLNDPRERYWMAALCR